MVGEKKLLWRIHTFRGTERFNTFRFPEIKITDFDLGI